MSDERTDGSAEVAIVGAGPIGVELAVALKRRGIDYLGLTTQKFVVLGHGEIRA